ncbi:WD40 repeat-containing protein, putative [Bodo saltans]|uniref:WD40 repeat-containing protein, putative n=1 Tax=Bodo saltans TaxID=75058 RepID=A0A0S4JBX0_BODSA|nr:WD40 repeat-containing protein, putative [Bodo saltans]|eukprot:CUG87604.1 WD40 repeat-containing protein, putative [Bodo saltans]
MIDTSKHHYMPQPAHVMGASLFATLKRGGLTKSVAFSPDGNFFATSSRAKTKLWRAADGAYTATLSGHSETVTSVAFSPDGALLATGSEDNTTKQWRVADGVCTATLAGHCPTRCSESSWWAPVTQPQIPLSQFTTRKINSRAVNPCLRIENPTDNASVTGLKRLKQSFIDDTASGEPLPSAHLLFAWHGTSPDRVAAGCRDGPRSLRTTDCGAGSYFALEAAYALRYSDPSDGKSAVILYALSVSQAKVITPERDYREVEDPSTPHLYGLSQCSGKPNTAVALAPGCDAHFIPVKNYGCSHPLTHLPTPRDVDYQAVDESSGEAEAHEIVIESHHRCIPIAIVYFNT